MEIRFSPLFSGSSGNAIYVGCGDTHILVDAGLSGSRVAAELNKIGVPPERLSAILTTHEHIDHIRGVGILARKYHLPVYASEGTWHAMDAKIGAVEDKQRCIVAPEENFYIGELEILPFSIPHDAAQPVGFSFERDGARFCIATDVGCVKKGWMKYVRGADAVLLESNYDPGMLQAGGYPYELKRRILSSHGHLSNDDAADCAVQLAESGTRQLILGHLSKENNYPALALECTQGALTAAGALIGGLAADAYDRGRAGEYGNFDDRRAGANGGLDGRRAGVSDDVHADIDLRVANRDAVTGLFAVSAEY